MLWLNWPGSSTEEAKERRGGEPGSKTSGDIGRSTKEVEARWGNGKQQQHGRQEERLAEVVPRSPMEGGEISSNSNMERKRRDEREYQGGRGNVGRLAVTRKRLAGDIGWIT